MLPFFTKNIQFSVQVWNNDLKNIVVEQMEMKKTNRNKRLSTERSSHQKGKWFFLTIHEACVLTRSTVYICRNCFNVFWPASLIYS